MSLVIRLTDSYWGCMCRLHSPGLPLAFFFLRFSETRPLARFFGQTWPRAHTSVNLEGATVTLQHDMCEWHKDTTRSAKKCETPNNLFFCSSSGIQGFVGILLRFVWLCWSTPGFLRSLLLVVCSHGGIRAHHEAPLRRCPSSTAPALRNRAFLPFACSSPGEKN